MMVSQNYKLGDQVGYLLRLAYQRHTAIFQEIIQEDITPMQFAALIRIDEADECSQNMLGRLSGMDVATIKGVVDRLGQKGLTVSRSDPNDKRRTLLTLSILGKELIEKIKPSGHEISLETLKPLSKSERKVLIRVLKKIS